MPVTGLTGLADAKITAGEANRQLAGLRRRADEVRTGSPDELRQRMQELVGGVFFGLLIKEMRKTLPGSKYFHGGQGERIFMAQFDQEIARRMSETLPSSLVDPMVEQVKWRLQDV